MKVSEKFRVGRARGSARGKQGRPGWRLLREGTAAAGQWAWAYSIVHSFIQDTPPARWSCTHRRLQKWLHSLEGLPGKINPGEDELLEPLEGSLPKPGDIWMAPG